MNYYNYFTEIEDTFVRRRGKHLLLSPLDWALIESWQDRSIPLHVVLRAIESVFDVFDKSKSVRTIKGLMYCREEVEAQFAEWSERQIGKSDNSEIQKTEFSCEQIERHINHAVEKLSSPESQALSEDFSRAVARLNELLTDLTDDYEAVDGSLADIEKLLDRSLLENTKAEKLNIIKKNAANELKAYRSGMEKQAYDDTLKLMVLKKLREEADIPRLGLFYL